MHQPPFAKRLKRYLNGKSRPDEVRAIDQWYEAHAAPPSAPLTPAELAAAKARMWQRVERQRQAPASGWHRHALRWAAAAVVAVGLGVALQLALRSAAEVNTASNYSRQTTVSRSDGWITCQNTTSKTASLALADGSTVVLQPGSSLRYPGRFTGTQRLVTLSGEAFFEVAHDTTRPFRVLTAQLTTTVLGTSFTVRALPGSADAVVMVRTGRVKVSPRPDQFVSPEAARPAPPADVVVLPNQQAVFSQRSGKMRRELVAEPAPLQPAVLRFDERPVAEVLASLEHTYGVPIRYDGAALAGCTVSLAFGQESLFEKLDLLSKALGASYEQVEESIVFRSRGCQSE